MISLQQLVAQENMGFNVYGSINMPCTECKYFIHEVK